jgi:hypothetical protein
MTSKRDWFQEYKPLTTSFIVYMGDDTESHVASVGTILIQLSIDQITNVIDVMCVPTLFFFLLSINKAINKGHSSMELFSNHCVIKSMDQNGKQFVFHCQ